MSTECYVRAFLKCVRRNFACLDVSNVCPCAVLCEILYIYSKSVINDSPCAEALFYESRELIVVAVGTYRALPLAFVNTNVSCLISIGILVVAVVSECATYKVMLITVNCEYYACITGVSVELCLEFIYIVGVCSNCILGLCYVTEVITCCVAGGVLCCSGKRVTVCSYVVLVCEYLIAYCSANESLVLKTCEINCVVLYEGEKVVDSNFLFFLFRSLGSFGLTNYAVSLSLENSVLLCIDGVEVNCEEYVVNCCRSCKVTRYYSCSYVAFGLLVSLNVSAVSHLVKLGYSAVVVLARFIRIILNCRIYRCTVNGYLVDIVTAVLACGYIKLEGVDSYGFLEAVSEYVVVLYGRTVSELELGTVVRIGVVHRTCERLTVSSTCCAATAVVTNAERGGLVGHGERIKSINIVMIVVIENVTLSRKLIISCVCITEQNVSLFSLGCAHRNDRKYRRKKHRNYYNN